MTKLKIALTGALFCFFLSCATTEITKAPSSKEPKQSLEAPLLAEEYRIGVILPLSGNSRIYGESFLHGIECALGVRPPCYSDRPAQLIVKDSFGDPIRAAQLAEELVYKDHVAGILGPLLRTEAEAVAAQAQSIGVPLINLSQHETAHEVGDYVFHIGVDQTAQVKTVLDYAHRKLGIKKYAVLYPENTYGERMKNEFLDGVGSENGEIVSQRGYKSKTLSIYKALSNDGLYKRPFEIENLKEADAIFIPDSYRMVSRLVSGLGKGRLGDGVLLGINRWNNPGLLEFNPKSFEGAIFVDAFYKSQNNPIVETFVAQFSAAYESDPTILEATGYDAARLMMSAISQGGSSRRSIAKALHSTKKFPGVTGLLKFDRKGHVERDLVVLTVEKGQFAEAPLLDGTSYSYQRNYSMPAETSQSVQSDNPLIKRKRDTAVFYPDGTSKRKRAPTDASGKTKYGDYYEDSFGN